MRGEPGADAVVQADGALARSLAYRFLSQAFAYPMPPAISELQEEDLPLVRSWAVALPEAVREAAEAAALVWGDAPAADLETEFRDLFSHVHSADCPMYETDYGSRDVWRQTSVLVDIAGFYRAFGMHEDAERPDHVATELEFLHLLTYKEAWAGANGDEEHARLCRDAVRGFLGEHVLCWMPAFAARVEALDGGGRYAAAGRLLASLLRDEADRSGLEIATDAAPPEITTPHDEPPSLCETEP